MALDERLRREIERAARPADPSGVYEELIRRRERRRIARRVQRAGLAFIVIAGSIVGVAGLARVFGPGDGTPGVDPSPVPILPLQNGRIAYSLSTSEGMELHSVLPDGTQDEVIPTPDGLPWLHAWSPDGSSLAVSIFPLGAADREIWVMNADGSNPVRIAAAENVSVPSWSPDGSTIAYTARTGRRTEIHLVAPDGTGDRVIHSEGAEGTFAIFSAQFSPDGLEILLDRGTDSRFDIFVMDVDGSNVRQLTTTGTDYDPHWSPDGTRIVFTRQGQGGSDIYAMDADGMNVVQLTDGGAGSTNLYPQWSPDGGAIAYVAGVTGGPGPLMIMNPDGSEPRTLVDGEVLGISWQPLAEGATIPPVELTPTISPDPEMQDIGLGFPVCNVTSVTGRFGDPNTVGFAYVATRMGDTGGCPDATAAFNVVAVDFTQDGLADASYGPIVCENAACVAWAAPDVDGDGTDELLVQNIAFSIAGLKLFEIGAGGEPGADGPFLFPVTVEPPGTAAFGSQGFEGGTEPQFWLGGDAGNAGAIRCEPYQGGRAFISTTSNHPIEGPGDVEVTETTFVLENGELRVVDVQEFTWPVNDDSRPFLETGGCGTDLEPYG